MLKIIRGDIEIDKDIVYDVIIDDLGMLEIGNDELKNLKIKNGQHTIMVKNKEFVSNKIEFSINSGEIIEFECGPRYQNNFWSKSIYKYLYSKEGLYIKKRTDFYL